MNQTETAIAGQIEIAGVSIRPVAGCCNTAGWLDMVSGKPYPALLESSLYDPGQGRFSILCWEPYKKITLRDRAVEITDLRCRTCRTRTGNPFQILAEEFEADRPGGPFEFPLPFAGGAIGYFSYDLRHRVESLPTCCSYDLPVPQLTLCFYDRAIIFDHKAGVTYLVNTGECGTEEINGIAGAVSMNAPARMAGQTSPVVRCRLESNFSPSGYTEAVGKVLEYIRAGDIFQANLSQRFQGVCNEDGSSVYQRLRRTNPAPVSAFLRYPEFDIISSSPERFLLLDGDAVSTRPIKGTRPRRQGDRAFNQKMKHELLHSEKDHAELAMIVDLERNDLGRVCTYGTVRVVEHAALETYPTVYHLVSTVNGRLHRERCNEFDLIRAAFPGGSITGAPKIRAMEIIEELEPVARNIYTGSIGYISFHGRMDLNILIRTMLLIDGRVYMQFGGGIVADSDPEAEYRETIHKGNALFRAVGASNYQELMASADG